MNDPFELTINGLRFEYQVNYDKKSNPSSLTFTYKYKFPMNIPYRDSIGETCNDFIDILTGKKFGGTTLEKYKFEDIYCYLIYDGSLYKIGKSKDPNKRLKEFKTGNPSVEIICTSKFIPEKFLHDTFFEKNFDREWFDLDLIDLNCIKEMMKAKTQDQANVLMRMVRKKIKSAERVKHQIKTNKEETRKYRNYKLTFGKYNGKKLKEMTSPEEKDYLIWIYKNYSNRKHFIIECLENVLNLE